MEAKKKSTRSSNSKRQFQKLLANKLSLVGFIILVVITLMCTFAFLLTKWDPSFIDMSLRYAEPSSEHILGCDQSGRDVWARVLYGGRISIAIGIVCSVLANVLGAVVGCVSGYYGGKLDQALVFVKEIFGCFPTTMIVLVVMGLSGQGVLVMCTIFVLTGWPSTMSYVRSRMLSLKTETFVENLRSTGVGSISIMFRHLLPNTLGVFIINITTNIGGYVLSEAGLSFLGLGVPKGIPTWGNMLNAARSFTVMSEHPLLWIIPGIAVSLFALGAHFLGDGLRDVFDVKTED